MSVGILGIKRRRHGRKWLTVDSSATTGFALESASWTLGSISNSSRAVARDRWREAVGNRRILLKLRIMVLLRGILWNDESLFKQPSQILLFAMLQIQVWEQYWQCMWEERVGSLLPGGRWCIVLRLQDEWEGLRKVNGEHSYLYFLLVHNS